MFEMSVKRVMQRRKLVQATPDVTVREAAKLMAKKNVGAIVIVEAERLIGIFTERDMVVRVVAKGRNVDATKVGAVMTRSPYTIDPDAEFGEALLIMHEKGFRHLPVLENGRPVGMVSARSAMDPELEDFVSEAQRRKHFARRVPVRAASSN